MLISTEHYYHRGKNSALKFNLDKITTIRSHIYVNYIRKHVRLSHGYLYHARTSSANKNLHFEYNSGQRTISSKVIMAEKISEFNSVEYMALISRVKTHGLRDSLACPRVLLWELEKVTKNVSSYSSQPFRNRKRAKKKLILTLEKVR